MQNFLSILPGLISLALLGFLILTGASIFLIRDLRRMRKEHQEGIFSVWYRRPRIRNGLKGIGVALMIVVGTVWWGWSAFLPSGLSDISEFGIICVEGSILLVTASISLICDLRNLQGKRREGLASAWYRQSEILWRIGWIVFLCNSLQSIGCIEHIELMRYFLHRVSYRILIPSSVISFVLIPVSLFFYCVAAILQKKNRHSNRAYKQGDSA